MGIEYSAWGPSRRWRGRVVRSPFRPIRLPDAVVAALDAAADAPAYVGSASKHFDDMFSRLFFGYDNKLLSPDDARATAAWIAAWADAAGRDPEMADAARTAARRLAAAAEHDWYLDWEV